MKLNKVSILLTLALSMLTSSCMNDLDIVQDNRLSASNMWTEESDATSAAYGLYDYLRDAFNTNYVYWGEYRSGLWGPGTHNTLLDNYQTAVANGTMNSSNGYADWTDLYTTINQANLILKYVPKMTISEVGRNFSMANAHYVRAICYFWIARIWGDAPLCKDGFESTKQDMYLPRSPKAEIYQLVESDILETEKYIQNTMTDKTIVTPAALAMLKADFALWMYTNQQGGEGYLTMAAHAIGSLNLSAANLESDFGKIFSSTSKLGKEVIFAIHKADGEAVNGYTTQWAWNQGYLQSAYINSPVPIGSNQWWLYTDAYIKLITENKVDKRTSVTYGHGPYGSGNVEVKWPNKYIGQMTSGTRCFDSDIIVYRYAQAYLFDAEIKYYQKQYGQALIPLGVITNRAYGNASLYQDASPAAVLDAIVKENLKEFACEGNIWWTLVRTNTIWDYNASLNQQKDKVNILLWPITQSSLNKNSNLVQTEGWIGK